MRLTASAANAVLQDFASANASVASLPLSHCSPSKFCTHGADSPAGQGLVRLGCSGQDEFQDRAGGRIERYHRTALEPVADPHRVVGGGLRRAIQRELHGATAWIAAGEDVGELGGEQLRRVAAEDAVLCRFDAGGAVRE